MSSRKFSGGGVEHLITKTESEDHHHRAITKSKNGNHSKNGDYTNGKHTPEKPLGKVGNVSNP